MTVSIEDDQNTNIVLGIPSEGVFRIVEIFIEPTVVEVSDGGEQHVRVSQTVFASLAQSEMGESLPDAAPMVDKAGYEYKDYFCMYRW